MFKAVFSLSLLFALPYFASAQVRLLVAGNTADAGPGFFRSLHERIAAEEGPTAVLFAGDYLLECTAAMRNTTSLPGTVGGPFAALEPLVDLARRHPQVAFYLVPGDRDWDQSGVNGLDCVKALEQYFLAQGLTNLHWPLPNGCPGPEVIPLSPTVLLMLLNTQWWNHPYDKPVPADADCDFADTSIALDEITSTIEENRDRNIVIAGHYPPKSQGRRGGSFPTRDHLVPPIIGSFRLSWRQNVGTPDEITNARFAEIGDKLRDFNGYYSGLFFIGAQDRSQQLLRFRNNYILNAGAAGPGRWVARHKPALHTSREPGYTELHFAADGEVSYAYYRASNGTPAWRKTIYHAPCGIVHDSLPINPAFPPCGMEEEAMEALPDSFPARVTTVAGEQYARSGFARTFLGTHYRRAWTVPVEVPTLDLAQEFGQLRPTEIGGGRQTTSLKLRNERGEGFVFRSVDKNPSKALDFEIRNTVIGSTVRDQTSSGHPYGAVVVAPLLTEIGILHANPRLFVLPPQAALQEFNAEFGGMLGTLEIRPEGEEKKQREDGVFDAEKVLKSYELFRERFDDQEVVIDYREYLRARLFDLLIGDWSRQEDNWKWALYEVGAVRHVRPIPRDRDNAFSRMDGVFPWIVSRRWAVAGLENFGFGRPDIRSLSHEARHLDRLLLSSMGREDYRREAATIQAALTDSVIEAAVREMPAAAYESSGPELVAKLKKRRDDLGSYADAFFRLYAERVDVVGTNDEERFEVHTDEDGRVTVTAIDLKGKSEGKTLYYREFVPGETREICIYGLGDDDQFQLTGRSGGPIRIRLIGGPGGDQFASEVRKGRNALAYENSKAQYEDAGPGLRFVRNWRDELYYYDRTARERNSLAPTVGVGYNSFNGASLGVGLVYTRRNFTRRDYAARYRVYVEGSTLGNFAVELNAEYGEVLGKLDLVFNSHLGRPDFYNFFYGLGNNSVKDPERVRNEFYLIRLQTLAMEGGLRRSFAGRSSFSLLAGHRDAETINTENTVLDTDDAPFGTGTLGYAYLYPALRLDLRDHPKLPSKGVLFEASQKWGRTDGGGAFGVSKVAAEIHFSTRRFPISLSLRTGYANSQGTVPFYELPTLGRNYSLRGYERNRFVGDGYLHYNVEFRTPFALIRSRVVPFALGLRLFLDRGKILTHGESGAAFKTARGFGLYIIPVSRSFTLSATAGFSKEEKGILQVSAGTRF